MGLFSHLILKILPEQSPNCFEVMGVWAGGTFLAFPLQAADLSLISGNACGPPNLP